MVTGERIGAEAAFRIGLVHEVAEDLDAAVERAVTDILAGGPTAVREAKRLVLEPGDEDDLLARAAERRTSDEGQEGLRAFLEKRPPGWA
jgi:methylglutaconyl-CoA hydratase